MIVVLQPDQIGALWGSIKHGILVTGRFTHANPEELTNQMLQELMLGRAQCWMGFQERDGERVFYAFGITTIVKDSAFSLPYLFLHTLYAYRPMPPELVEEIVPTLETFARNSKCAMLVTFTAVERLQQLYLAAGFTDDQKLYTKML